MTDSTAVERTPRPPAFEPPDPSKSSEQNHANFLMRLATVTTYSEMMPKALRGRPDAAFAVMLFGHELGLQPMTSLREVYIIEGTTSMSARLMRALIYRAGHRLEFREVSRERVVLYGERADGMASEVVTWDLEDAKLAGLLGKDNWKRYPRAMLKARATSELARDLFPDMGLGYTPEELTRHDLSGTYDYVDVEESDLVIGEEGEDRRPDHVIVAEVLDAEDAEDAEWVEEARAEAEEDARGAALQEAEDAEA